MKPITLEKDSYTLIFEEEYIEVKTNDDNLYAFFETEKHRDIFGDEYIEQITDVFDIESDKNIEGKDSIQSFIDISHKIANELSGGIDEMNIVISDKFAQEKGISTVNFYENISNSFDDINYEKLRVARGSTYPLTKDTITKDKENGIVNVILFRNNNVLEYANGENLDDSYNETESYRTKPKNPYYEISGNINKQDFKELTDMLSSIDESLVENTKELNIFTPSNLEFLIKELPDDGGFTGKVEMRNGTYSAEPKLIIENFLKFEQLTDIILENSFINERKIEDYIENDITAFSKEFLTDSCNKHLFDMGWTEVKLNAVSLAVYENVGNTFGKLCDVARNLPFRGEVELKNEYDDFRMSYKPILWELEIQSGKDKILFESAYTGVEPKDLSVVTEIPNDNGEIENILKEISKNLDEINRYSCKINGKNVTREIDTKNFDSKEIDI